MAVAKKLETAELTDGAIEEQDGIFFFKCNRPLSWVEHINLVAKVELEEQRVGRKIIIVPHATEVVKS